MIYGVAAIRTDVSENISPASSGDNTLNLPIPQCVYAPRPSLLQQHLYSCVCPLPWNHCWWAVRPYRVSLYEEANQEIIEEETALKNGVFWVVTPCGSCKNRRVGGTWRLLHQGDKNW
jgi:hypothetical protein